jgi:hypothetical protein
LNKRLEIYYSNSKKLNVIGFHTDDGLWDGLFKWWGDSNWECDGPMWNYQETFMELGRKEGEEVIMMISDNI